MKKYLLFMAAIMMAVCCMTLVSCGDEELEPDGGSSSSGGNGEAPKAVKAVDLGLPSGTLWATMNIGASSPEDYGDYFAWGETEGRTYFSWRSYKWCMGNETTLTKYCYYNIYGYYGFEDNKKELDYEDDAAYVNWGPAWRIPSMEQLDELINSEYTTTEWTTVNGVNGRKITSKTNGNAIFLPAAGWRSQDLLRGGSDGLYWSRFLRRGDWTNVTDAKCLNVNNGDGIMYKSAARCLGLSIRPVRATE